MKCLKQVRNSGIKKNYSRYNRWYYRLDFVSFTIGGPSTTAPTVGTCTDTFTVGGSTSTTPTICGVNTGQHSKLDKLV
jgi:hypothetical protein